MKKILLYLFIINTTINWSQFSIEENEMTEIIKTNGTLIPSIAFLDTSIIKDMRLINSTGWRHLWTDIEDSSKNIMQFYDIRLKFDSKKKALKFHKKYMGLNSEFGQKINSTAINNEGALNMQIFSGSTSYATMMDPYGYHIICFLFVVDNYFVKLYFNCKKELTPINFQNYISDSIKRIKKTL